MFKSHLRLGILAIALPWQPGLFPFISIFGSIDMWVQTNIWILASGGIHGA